MSTSISRIFCRRMYRHSANKRTSDEQKLAKSRVSPELDNLLDVGFNFRMKPDGDSGHKHEGLAGDYKYLDAIFKIGSKYYQATINIEQNKRGDRLKDVTKIENITERSTALEGKPPRTVSPDDVSKNSIAEDAGKGNTQNQTWDLTDDDTAAERNSRQLDAYANLYAIIKSSGYSPSDDELAAAGMSRAAADAIAAEYRRNVDLDERGMALRIN